MQLSKAHQPVVAAAVSLLAFGACLAGLLAPLSAGAPSSIALTALLGIAIGVAFVLHLTFLGLAASRLGRSPLWWIVVAVLTFPIASIVGLILFEWFSDPRNRALENTQA